LQLSVEHCKEPVEVFDVFENDKIMAAKWTSLNRSFITADDRGCLKEWDAQVFAFAFAFFLVFIYAFDRFMTILINKF
jgi:hypothetical protein